MDFKNWLFLTEAFELPYSAYKEIVDWLLGVASKKRFEYESKTFKLDLTGTRFSFLHDNKNNPDIKDEIDIVVEAYVRNKDTKNSGSYSVSSFRANKLSDDQLWIQSKIKIYLSNKKFYYEVGRKYIHIIMEDNQRSSHSWVVMIPDKKFNFGDILKSASWKAPAKNFARGNVIEGNFQHIRWCGA